MKGVDKFLEWYQQRFNTIVEQPPREVWDNISKELDINEVWSKVDSKLNRIDRRRVLVRRSVYTSLLLLFLLGSGSLIVQIFNTKHAQLVASSLPAPQGILRTGQGGTTQSVTLQAKEHQNLLSYKSVKSESIITNKKDNQFSDKSVSKPNNGTNKQTKKWKKDLNNNVGEVVINTSRKHPSISSSSQVKEQLLTQQSGIFFTESENAIGSTSDVTLNSKTDESNNDTKEEFLTASMPFLLVSDSLRDFEEQPYFITFPFTQDSGYYPNTNMQGAGRAFRGFYSGITSAMTNTWLLNQFTFNGLKAKSLSQTNIDFGYVYGISAGYNFNNHVGGELNWYIDSREGQTYNFYDEGRYVTQKIRMDLSVINMTIKCRNQGFNSFLNIPKSQNILLGMNLGIFKRDRSSLTFMGNDNIALYQDIIPKFDATRYSLAFGYEYEVLAFHKIMFSSSFLGNIGLSSIYKNDMPVPVGFTHTYSSSVGINFSAKYLIN